MSSLLAHKDTSRVKESTLASLPVPQWTDTFHPITHYQIAETLDKACKELGLDVRSKDYSLNATGSRMFGVWHLDLSTPNMGYALGIRNATDKSMAYGLCAGTSVFVCDNLCFSGSFIRFRKHTSGLDLDELEVISREAIGGAVIEMEKMVDWQEGLQELWVPKSERKELIYDMATQGVFSPGQINNYLGCLDEELQIRRGRALDNAHSLYNMHGAATRLMRPWPLLRVSEATRALNGLCDQYIERREMEAA